MNIDDIRSLSVDEINKNLLDLKKEQMNLRFQKTSGQIATPNRIREVRTTIARLNTVLTQKTNTASAAQAAPVKKIGKGK